jgi:nucleoside-triphosphatase THEP1
MTAEPILLMITGFRGSGKTVLCRKLVEAARQAGWRVSGILSNPVFEGQTRVAIQAEDLKSGEVRTLAARREPDSPGSAGLHTRNWQFDSAVLDWGNQVLQSSVPTDLLVVDELGTLEFERGQGWQAGLEALDSGHYQAALVVIRSELLGEALLRWQHANIVEIDTPEDSRRKAQGLIRQLFPTQI